ncbi:Hypothetical protein GLP15_1146 [Giardia lamblia P15]|uniref:GB1/RHD3-type G domain-containing protein n=1 Tax=Giardia intestinalis (strain P15) TaxID=658858 RepID=E1F8L8_GIAIA|nr:Hypothetical protein GLP15_1146 [Giardia lamblia P15]
MEVNPCGNLSNFKIQNSILNSFWLMSFRTEIPIITDEGDFSAEYERFCQTMDGATDGTFICVSVFGPQSSGKSTLLNDLFGTSFKTMNLSAGRSQTTKGIMARAVDFQAKIASRVLILDCEGSDSRERNQQEAQNIERHIGCFAAAVSDLLIINVWNHDIGRHSAANYNILSTIFDIYFRSLLKARRKSGNHRPLILLIAIRDAEEDGAELTQKTFESDVHHIYEQSVPKQYHGSFKDYFCLRFWFIPHRRYMKSLYDEKIAQLQTDIKEIFNSFLSAEMAATLIPLMDSSIYYSNIWDIVRTDKDLDIPSQREIISNIRCEEFYLEAMGQFSSQISKVFADVTTAIQVSLSQQSSAFLEQSSDAVKDYPITKLHNACNSFKLTKVLMDLSQECVTLYRRRTRHYIPKVVTQWATKLYGDILVELKKVAHSFAKGIRESTCQALSAVTAPFRVQITQWLERHEYSDDYASNTNAVDILVPDLISDLTFPQKRITDLMGLLGAATRVFHKCISVNWVHEYSALRDTGILVNLPPDDVESNSNVHIGDNIVPTNTDSSVRLSVGYEASEPMGDTPIDDSGAFLSDIKQTGVYSPHLYAFLESLSLSTYGKALSLQTLPTTSPDVANAYDAVCLLHTIILLWYCETMMPLGLIYDVTPELDHIIPESNALFCETMGSILAAVVEAVSSQTRAVTGSMTQATARLMDDKLYVTLGSLRGVIYESARKTLERSFFSLLSSVFVASDHQGLLYLQTRLSSPSVYLSLHADSSSKSELTDSILPDIQNPVYKQYTDIYLFSTLPALLSPPPRAYNTVGARLSSGSSLNQLSLPRYRAVPIIAALDMSAFYIPQAALSSFMDRIDAEIVELISKNLGEFFSKSLPLVLQNKIHTKLIYDDQGAQRSYISEDSISAEFLSAKKGLISMAQLFEGGSLITEDLHSVTIKPTSQEKIDAMLRCVEGEWDKTYQEALEIYRANKHKDKYKWMWLGLCILLVLTRRWVYAVLLSKYCLYVTILVLSVGFFVYQRTTPDERNRSLSVVATSIRERNIEQLWNATKTLVQKVIH